MAWKSQYEYFSHEMAIVSKRHSETAIITIDNGEDVPATYAQFFTLGDVNEDLPDDTWDIATVSLGDMTITIPAQRPVIILYDGNGNRYVRIDARILDFRYISDQWTKTLDVLPFRRQYGIDPGGSTDIVVETATGRRFAKVRASGARVSPPSSPPPSPPVGYELHTGVTLTCGLNIIIPEDTPLEALTDELTNTEYISFNPISTREIEVGAS